MRVDGMFGACNFSAKLKCLFALTVTPGGCNFSNRTWHGMQDGRWRWDGDWDVDTSADTDQEGWQYGFAWTSTMGPDCTSTVSQNL